MQMLMFTLPSVECRETTFRSLSGNLLYTLVSEDLIDVITNQRKSDIDIVITSHFSVDLMAQMTTNMLHKHFPSSVYKKLIDDTESTRTYALATLWMHIVHVPIYYTHTLNTGVQVHFCRHFIRVRPFRHADIEPHFLASSRRRLWLALTTPTCHCCAGTTRYDTLVPWMPNRDDRWVRYHDQWYRRRPIDR